MDQYKVNAQNKQSNPGKSSTKNQQTSQNKKGDIGGQNKKNDSKNY